MNNIITNPTALLSDISFLSFTSNLLLLLAVILALLAVTRSMRRMRHRLVIERVIVESLAETLKEKGLESSIQVKGNKFSVRLSCPDHLDPRELADEIMKETIRKASTKGYSEISKIINEAKDKGNENYINALFDKSLNILQKNA